MSDNYKDESRKLWRSSMEKPSTDQIQLGCLQRIADATELMAKNHDQLVADRDRYQRWYDQQRERSLRLERSNAALRGVITKMKKGRP